MVKDLGRGSKVPEFVNCYRRKLLQRRDSVLEARSTYESKGGPEYYGNANHMNPDVDLETISLCHPPNVRTSRAVLDHGGMRRTVTETDQ